MRKCQRQFSSLIIFYPTKQIITWITWWFQTMRASSCTFRFQVTHWCSGQPQLWRLDIVWLTSGSGWWAPRSFGFALRRENFSQRLPFSNIHFPRDRTRAFFRNIFHEKCQCAKKCYTTNVCVIKRAEEKTQGAVLFRCVPAQFFGCCAWSWRFPSTYSTHPWKHFPAFEGHRSVEVK